MSDSKIRDYSGKKVFLGLTEVSGYFSRLQRGFTKIGVYSEHVSLYRHHFGYGGEPSRWHIRWAQSAVLSRSKCKRENYFDLFKYVILTLNVVISRSVLLVWSLSAFDIFVIGAGSGFFGLRELPVLKFFGKKIIYTLHGTDVRPPYIDGFFPPYLSERGSEHANADANLVRSLRAETYRRKKWIGRLEKYADAIVCGPSYAQFLTKPFVSFYAIGLPTEEARSVLQDEPFPSSTGIEATRSEKILILHAPSHLKGKGTATIRGVIDELTQEGLAVEYREIVGQPNQVVMAALVECDIVVDQLYSDTPMAGFAAEAAAHGKPSVVGGYFSSIADWSIPREFLPPTLFCMPDTLLDNVRELVLSGEARASLGGRAQQFVTSRWSTTRVAESLLRLVDGPVPQDWMVSPQNVVYTGGCGLPESEVVRNVRLMVDADGIESLCIDHNPQLVANFQEMLRS